MKRIILLLLILAVLVGCQSKTVEYSTDDGNVKIEATGVDSDEWCQTGAQWKMSGSFDEGNTNAQWVIKGLMTSGQFAGLCHVEYKAVTPEGTTTMDYYFSEDGESGYVEMDINGQKFTQEWNG